MDLSHVSFVVQAGVSAAVLVCLVTIVVVTIRCGGCPRIGRRAKQRKSVSILDSVAVIVVSLTVHA